MACKQHLILVGGLAESPYIQRKLREALEPDQISVITGDESNKNAITEDAILWFLKELVVSRAVRSTFGIDSSLFPPETCHFHANVK